MEDSPVWQLLRYHEETKHRPERYAPGPGSLDWASQPEPFRFYQGVTPVLLPLLEQDPAGGHLDLYERSRIPSWDLGVESVGAFLELSLGLSSWKKSGETKWPLRMNPSSGNLHPTEAHLVLPPLSRDSRQARQAMNVREHAEETQGGLFHYNPYLHALEPRAALSPEACARWRAHFQAPGFLIGLTSIYWREAWKYGERAFRYCQHDVGHALAALSFAGNLLGWKVTYLNAPSDGDLAIFLGLNQTVWPADEAEAPEALCFVSSAAVKAVPRALPSDLLRGFGALTVQGTPNRLSPAHVHWPLLAAGAEAARKPRLAESSVRFTTAAPLLSTPASALSAAALIRQRRSALAFDGETTITRRQFDALLDKTLPRNGVAPFDLELGAARVHLVLFVHRVVGLETGLYFLLRHAEELAALKRSCGRGLLWQPVDGPLPLYLLKTGSFETEAAHLSCHQLIAGRGVFSLGMLAPFRPLLERSPWLYKPLFWECGQIGQALYLEAEAQGVRGTGIGCFFDDIVHEILGVQQQAYQSLYHFSVGGPVDDDRLSALEAYQHLPKDRLPLIR
jgi:nitroreductase